jgi:signal transduction histidine kinase
VGLETVLQLIVDSAKELIPGAEHAVLHLLDSEHGVLVPRAVAGIPDDSKTSLNMHPGEGIAGQVFATGEVINIPDTQVDPKFLDPGIPVKFRSIAVAPIQSKDHCVGTISVQSELPNMFTPDESQLLGALGTQASIAIENANLLETTRQDLKEINALYRVTQGMARSLDPDQLMKDVVEFLYKDFGYYHVQIFVKDSQSGELVARCGAGTIGDQLKEQGFRLPVGEGIVGHVAETGKPFVSNDVDNIIFFQRNPLLPDTQSELTVPIKIGDQVVGVLDIQRVPPDRLTLRDLNLMIVVADQLAVALQKANLYAELQTALGQEKSMRSQLIQSERLAVVGRLLASVSHELNNPLQAIQNALFLLRDEEVLSTQGDQDLEIILSETERMAALIERLRSAYRPTRTEDFQDVRLNDIVQDVCALTATHMRHKQINFVFDPDPKLPAVPGIPDQIRQVVLNLVMNAVESIQMGGQITVCTHQLPAGNKISLSVTDTGTGIDPELLPHVFEPFVTSKETGTGLGLTITSDIIRHHHGEILAENNPEGGATFKVWLPIKNEGRI